MKFTELELKILKILWSLQNRATVQQVLDNWEEKETPKYTTVLKTLQIMEQKGIIRHEKNGRSYDYIPKVSREKATGTSLGNLISTFFSGSRIALAETLINKSDYTRAELREIKKMIEQKEKQL